MFRLIADESTFAGAAGLVLAVFVAGAAFISLEQTVGGGGSVTVLTMIVLVPIITVIGAWACATTRRVAPAGDRCHGCGYPLKGITGGACPECGREVFVKPNRNSE